MSSHSDKIDKVSIAYKKKKLSSRLKVIILRGDKMVSEEYISADFEVNEKYIIRT